MARVPYLDPDNLPDEYNILESESDKLHESVDAERWNTAPTIRAFANNPELAELHVHTNVSLWTKTGLTKPEVEAVILSVARALDSSFEWHAHSITAIEQAGMTEEAVLAISRGNAEKLDEPLATLAAYATEFVRNDGNVSDETHEALQDYYDDGVIVGIVMLTAFYVYLQFVSVALRLDRDEEFVGWELQNYPLEETRLS